MSRAVFNCVECLGTLDLNDVQFGVGLCAACRQGDYEIDDLDIEECVAEYNDEGGDK